MGHGTSPHETKEIAMTNKKTDAVPAKLEPLLTVDDLERLLRVDRRTINRLLQRGKFPVPLMIGGRHRWRAADIEQLLSSPGTV